MKQVFSSCPKAMKGSIMKEQKENPKSLAIPVHQAIKVFEHDYYYISVNIKKIKPTNSDLVLYLYNNLLINIPMQSLSLTKKKKK